MTLKRAPTESSSVFFLFRVHSDLNTIYINVPNNIIGSRVPDYVILTNGYFFWGGGGERECGQRFLS